MISMMAWPVGAYADWNHGGGNHGGGHDGGGHDGGHHDYHGHGGGVNVGFNFGVWPDTYYYGGPYYPAGDVLVSSPVYEPVVVNGTTYYLNNGTYYIYTSSGYQPIAPPAEEQPQDSQPPPLTQPAPTVTAAAPADTGSDADITVNIPNKKGGYTAVTLKKSGNGYVGPQGEFYAQFPKISQLEAIYGNG
jgi:hypothetical protein